MVIKPNIPEPPTSEELRLTFADIKPYAMLSDEIIWRPVKFKFLFGENADPSLKASFQVVKLKNTSISDGEVKSKIIKAINDYFKERGFRKVKVVDSKEASNLVYLVEN